MLFNLVVPRSSFAFVCCPEDKRSLCSCDNKRYVSAIQFNTRLVRFEVEKSVRVVPKVVNKDVVIKRPDLALLVYYVVIPKNFVLKYYMFGKPPFEKVVGLF